MHRIVAGLALIVPGAVILSACSPTASSISAHQVSETASPIPVVVADPCDDLAADWDHELTGGVPEGIEFPAVVWADYAFSTEPQCDAEVWLQAAYPKLWEQGARAVAHDGVFWDWNLILERADERTATAPTVQYIDGVRYEGTGSMPLGFDGWTAPDEFQTQHVDGMIAVMNAPDGAMAWDLPNPGVASYAVFVYANDGFERGAGVGVGELNDTTVNISAHGAREADEDHRRFADWQEALTWVLTTDDLSPNIEGARSLHPGEISSISVAREENSLDGHQSHRFGVYHPDTHQIEWMNRDYMPVLRESQRFETFEP